MNYKGNLRNYLKQIIEKYIDIWIVSLAIVQLIVFPIVFLFIIGDPFLFMGVYIGSFVLWWPLIKIAENVLKNNL